MAERPIETYAPAELTALIVGEVNAIIQGASGHDIAAVTSAVLGLIPAVITFAVRTYRSTHPAPPAPPAR